MLKNMIILTSFVFLSISAEHVCKTRSKLLARLFHHTIHKESAVINTLLQASKFSAFPENKQLTLLQTFICRQSCPGDVYPCWNLEEELEDYIHSCYLQRSKFEESKLFNTNFDELFKNIHEHFPQIFKFGIDDLDFSEIIKSIGDDYYKKGVVFMADFIAAEAKDSLVGDLMKLGRKVVDKFIDIGFLHDEF